MIELGHLFEDRLRVPLRNRLWDQLENQISTQVGRGIIRDHLSTRICRYLRFQLMEETRKL